jgi:transketolase
MIEAQPNREMYGKTLVELGEREPRIVVFEADIAKSTNTYRFQKRFPERFFETGVAEMNMVCMAAGAATTGLIPFCSTFVVFLSMRACEGIRTSIAYPNLNVKIVATNAGVEIAGDGVTHQGVEDLAIMRAIPNLMVLSPSDPVTTRLATLAIAEHNGPVYMRLGRQTVDIIHREDVDFRLGNIIEVRRGRDITIVATGHMVHQALSAAYDLAGKGIEARVLDCHTVKPLDEEAILTAARETGGIVTAEDHNIIGGLGGAVCELVAERCPVPVRRVGLRDRFAASGRDYRRLMAAYGLTHREIERAALDVLAQKSVLGVQ